VRKHCRKSHPAWLANLDHQQTVLRSSGEPTLGLRTSIYCRETTSDEELPPPKRRPLSDKQQSLDTEGIPSPCQASATGRSESSCASTTTFTSSLLPPQPSSPQPMLPAHLQTLDKIESHSLEGKVAAHRLELLGADGESAIENDPQESIFAQALPPLKRGVSLAELSRQPSLAVSEHDRLVACEERLTKRYAEATFEPHLLQPSTPSERDTKFLDDVWA